ncbi:MAG: hypothetical protein HY898_00975 [Deltaproteobacteria bacterium]|nr:hypothetical protein [Deltaproteobacteria bacterium]
MPELPARSVTLFRLPAEAHARRGVAVSVGLALGVPLADALVLIDELPTRLPMPLAPDQASDLISRITKLGGEARDDAAALMTHLPCSAHPSLRAGEICDKCGANICVVCARRTRPARLCTGCASKKRRSRRFYLVRVGVLLSILALVVLYAVHDLRSRHARTDWRRPVSAALVVVRRGPVDDLAIQSLRERIPRLQGALQSECARYRSCPTEPIFFRVYGPIDAAEPPAPSGEGVLDLAQQSWAMWRYSRAVDARAGVDTGGTDAKIYLVVRPPEDEHRRFVEGFGELGGRLGAVSVELDPSMVDFALFVATHELLHTLGATDKYDPSGHVVAPAGLAEPDLVPVYPQLRAEVMARLRPIGPSAQVPPETLAELGIGPVTAREIGWTQ